MSDLRLWSVTSLVKMGLGTGEPLVNWGLRFQAEFSVDAIQQWARMDRDAAVDHILGERRRYMQRARNRGTEVHKAAEALALGAEPLIDPDLQPYVDQYRQWLETFQPEFLMAEAPVYNPTWGYAGTTDGIMRLGQGSYLFDLKTTPHGPTSEKRRPPFPEVALQTCAYSRAEVVGVLSEQRYASGKRYYLFNPEAQHEPMPAVDGALAIVISPEDCFAVRVRIDEVVWEAFLIVMRAAKWQNETSRDVFGPVIRKLAPAVLEAR